MYEELAIEFVEAMKKLSSNEDNCNNFISYLTCHFPEWLSKYGSTPENITAELKLFASF